MYRVKPYCSPPFARLLAGTFHHPERLARNLPPQSDPWSISPDLGVLLFRLVTEYRKSRVLEFGAGSSSIIFASALAEAGGGLLTSVEEDPRWCADKWNAVRDEPTVDAELVQARPELVWGRAGPSYIYRDATSRLTERGPYDLVLVDAPQYYYGRDGALDISYPTLAEGAFIVLDDAARSVEQRSVRRWLKTYRGLELRLYDPAFGGKGVAVLQVTGPLEPHVNASSVISSCYDAVELWTKRRRRRKRERRQS